MGLVLNEYEFWKSLSVPIIHDKGNKSAGQEMVALTKVGGLALVAKQVGRFTSSNLDLFMQVIDDMLAVQGDELCYVMKKIRLQEFINSIAQVGFACESQLLSDKLDVLLSKEREFSDFDNIAKIVSLNTQMSTAILNKCDYEGEAQTLENIVDICDVTSPDSVYYSLNAPFIYDRLTFQLCRPDYTGKWQQITMPLSFIYPDVEFVQLPLIGQKILQIQLRYMVKGEDPLSFMNELTKIGDEVAKMEFG